MQAHLTILVQVQLQRLEVLFKAQRTHCPEQIIPVDGLPLLTLAFIAGSA